MNIDLDNLPQHVRTEIQIEQVKIEMRPVKREIQKILNAVNGKTSEQQKQYLKKCELPFWNKKLYKLEKELNELSQEFKRFSTKNNNKYNSCAV